MRDPRCGIRDTVGHLASRIPDLASRSKPSELAEPLQRAAHFGEFQLVSAAELLKADPFEADAFE